MVVPSRKPRRRPALKVFKPVLGDGENNSLLHHAPEDWYAIAEGYKRAADVLVRHVLRTPCEWDYLVYPICFSYRHYLELKLKQIIRRGGWVAETSDELHPKHLLLPLWQRAEIILCKLWPDTDRAPLRQLEQIIREFDAVDPLSDAFRYPVDREGQEHLEGIEGLSVRHIAEVMSTITPFLDGAAHAIEDIRDSKAKAEYEALQHSSDEPPDYEPPDYD